MAMEHDARCEAQDRALAVMEMMVKNHDANLAKIVDVFDQRHQTFQDLREQTAAMQRDIAYMRKAVDEIEATLKTEVASKRDVDSIRRWGAYIGGAFILAFVSAFATFILRGGLR